MDKQSTNLLNARQEVEHLRKVITIAYRELRELASIGGDGSDGNLWQKHHEIADKLFSDSRYMYQHDMRQWVPLADFAELLKRTRRLETEVILLRPLQAKEPS